MKIGLSHSWCGRVFIADAWPLVVHDHVLKCLFLYVDFSLIISLFFFQWGAAYCVRGGPEKEKLVMQVRLFLLETIPN